MNTAPESLQADKFEIYYSPFIVLPATALFLLALGWIIFWAAAAVLSGHYLAVIVGALGAAVGLPTLFLLLPSIIHPWVHKGPVVTLDANGVTDIRKKNAFIPWSDIGRITLGVGESASILCFEFRKADRQLEDPPRLGLIGTILRRARTLSDWNVNLRLLACRRTKVLATAIRFHQRAIRRQIVLRNKGSHDGWSGTL